MHDFLDNIVHWVQGYPFLYDNLKFIGVFGLSVLSYFIVKRIVYIIVKTITARTKTELDNLVFNTKLIKRISIIAPVFVLNRFSYLVI